ncbi:MAG: DUF6531 domain-containing protein [Polyangiaceae bacterium]|nr:DUF6531 domain-containing protein [Polyangiaceae bacterium]
MSLLAAATIYDDIKHTPLLAMVFKSVVSIGVGLATSAIIGGIARWAATAAVTLLAGAFIIGTGGLGALVVGAVVGAVVSTGISMGADAAARKFGYANLSDAEHALIIAPLHEKIDKQFPGVTKGQISTGSPNVFINSRKAARAAGKSDPGFPARQAARKSAPRPTLGEYIVNAYKTSFPFNHIFSPPEQDFGFIPVDMDKVLCQDHPPMPEKYMAEGSDKVFINSQPAVRIGERSTCDGKVSISPANESKRNVSIGGNTIQVRAITSEKPGWLTWLEELASFAGLALSLCRGSWLNKLGKLVCFGVNMAVNMVVDPAVRGAGAWISGQSENPVHLPTGAKILNGDDDEDFTVAARLPLTWTRSYNSLNTRAGLFGQGWVVLHELELTLNSPEAQDPKGPHGFLDPMGRNVPVPELAPGEKCDVVGQGLTFGHTSGGHWMVQFPDGQIIDYGQIDDSSPASGTRTLRPWAIEDRNGNAHYLHYDDQGRLAAILTSCGQRVVLQYDEEHPRRVVLVGRQDGAEGIITPLAHYSYDQAGNLAEVRNPMGEVTRRFAYDAGQRMNYQRLPDGLEVHYQWQEFLGAALPDGKETCHARVVAYRTNAGEDVHINYALQGEGAGEATARDQLGREQHWIWDALRRVTHYRCPEGGVFTLQWDSEKSQLLAVINPAGGTTTFEYDDTGNIVSQTDPLGRTERTVWHDQFAEPVQYTAPDGRQWQWRYDVLGNITDEQGPGGLKRHWEYGAHGLLLAQTNAGGGLSTYVYDRRGQLVAATDSLLRTTRLEYDSAGQLSAHIDGAGQRREYARDGAGRLARLATCDGIELCITRDDLGRIISQQRGKDGQQDNTQWSYDHVGRLVMQRQGAGQVTRWLRDRAGRVCTLVDGNGQDTTFEYNKADRLTAQTGIDGLRTEYEVTPLGLIAVTQAAGTPDAIRIELGRDAVGRLIRKTTPETITTYAYDQADQVTTIKRRLRPELGDYAPTDQAIIENLPLIDEIHFSYDEAGRLVSESTAVHRLQQARGWQQLPTPRSTTIEHQHDELDNTIATTLPGGQKLSYLYYGLGYLHQINLDGQIISNIDRDALHRETRRTQGSLDTQWQRDPMGRTLQHQTARTGTQGEVLLKSWRYDGLGHLAQRHDRLLGAQHYAHDPTGRILHSRNVASTLPTQARRDLEEHFQWDNADNALPNQASLTSVAMGLVEKNRVRVWQDIRYDYDGLGRITRKQSGKRQDLRLKWNCESQLIASECVRQGVNTQHARYHYDALGRRIGKSDVFGTTWFVWSGMRMLQEERGTRVITTVYEGQGSYAPLARIEHGKEQKEIEPKNIYYFHNDINGAPEELTSHDGIVAWKARYRTWGNTALEEWTHEYTRYEGAIESRTQNLRLQGQYLDTETGLHYNTFRYYDPDIGRFASQDPIGLLGGINLYQYAPNPSQWIDPWGRAKESPCDKLLKNGVNLAKKIQKYVRKNNRFRPRSENAEEGISGYHGFTEHEMSDETVKNIVTNPDGVFQSSNADKSIIFAKDGDVAIFSGDASWKGQAITAYGPSGIKGSSGAAALGGKPGDRGEPVTHEMIENGTIPGYPAPATRLPGF